MATQQTEVENARERLAEGLARVREQSEHIERLYRDGRSVGEALQLLFAMRESLAQLETHLRFLVETEGRQE